MALYDRSCFMHIAPSELQEIAVPIVGGEIDYSMIDNAAAIAWQPCDEDAGGKVKAVQIDSLELDNVTFIKVDTQGSDLRVLQGAIETIKRCLPTIVFEFERIMTKYHGAELSDYEDFFETIGYKLTVLKNQFDGK